MGLLVLYTRPSIYLVFVDFGTAIPIHTSTLLENVFHTCSCAFFVAPEHHTEHHTLLRLNACVECVESLHSNVCWSCVCGVLCGRCMLLYMYGMLNELMNCH